MIYNLLWKTDVSSLLFNWKRAFFFVISFVYLCPVTAAVIVVIHVLCVRVSLCFCVCLSHQSS